MQDHTVVCAVDAPQLLDDVMQRVSARIGSEHVPHHTEPWVLAVGAAIWAGLLGK
jgi:molybdopterin-guanine dinucleotide biosynthesis protein A